MNPSGQERISLYVGSMEGGRAVNGDVTLWLMVMGVSECICLMEEMC